jgi:cellulose biosynthesis protein BcsQ
MTMVVTPRPGPRRIAIFNHKGGVGKTTLTTNIAFALVQRGKRVLLVDSDPQCNLTAYLVEEAVVNELLDESDSDAGQTVWSAVKPVSDGTGELRGINPLELRDGLFLLPGDVKLAEFEQELHTLWGECFQRRPRGFRGVVALSQLTSLVARSHDIDFVFFDSGPNIGSLNHSVLLDCDYFVIPAACDLFSVRAIGTLGVTLTGWIKDWITLSDLAPDGFYLFPGLPRFLGYIPQRFRVYRQRPAREYGKFIPMIERAIESHVIELLNRIDPELNAVAPESLKLGEVKDFGAIASASQRQGVPISEVDAGSFKAREAAFEAFLEIADEIISRTADAPTP